MAVGYTIAKPSDIFTGRTKQCSALRLGVQAYKQYVDKKLSDFSQLLASLVADDAMSANDGETEFSNDALIPVTINRGGRDYIAAITVEKARQLLAGATNNATAFFANKAAHNLDTPVGITASDLQDFIGSKVANLQAQSVMFGAALRSDLDAPFSASEVMAELTLRGFKTSTYLSNVVSAISSGFSWFDALQLVADNVSAPYADEDSGIWTFDAEEYSETSSIVLATRSVVDTVSGFFADIEFDILKLEEYFNGVVRGIKDAVSWLMTTLVGDVLSDYVVQDNYNIECFDIPIYSVRFYLEDPENTSVITNLAREYMSDSGIGGIMPGTVNATASAITPRPYGISYLPNYEELCRRDVIDALIPRKSTILVPWDKGYIYGCRDAEDYITIYYFLGDFDLSWSSSKWQSTSNGVISHLDTVSFSGSAEARNFSNNADFVSWFKSRFYDMGNNKYKIYTSYNFAGCGASDSSSSSTGLENLLPMIYDFTTLDGPSSIIQACSPWYQDTQTTGLTRVSGQMILNALAYFDISRSDVVHGGVVLKYATASGTDFTVEAQDFSNQAFVPYETNVMPVFKIHAQSDEERSAEMLKKIGSIALTAAAFAVTVGAMKAKKKLNAKAKLARLDADQAWWNARYLSGKDQQKAIAAAQKADRKARSLSNLAGIFSGDVVEEVTTKALRDYSEPSQADINTIRIINLLNGDL